MSQDSDALASADRHLFQDAEIAAAMREQDDEAFDFAKQFILTVIRLRGVRIDRDEFLTQEFRKRGVPAEQLREALERTPVEAGVELGALDSIAEASIAFESQKSAAMSFAAGLPGGLAMLASVPADITQYYVHAFRVMQKLAYLYGWKEFQRELKEVDDETLATFAMFLGVMMGVGGASASLGKFANQIAAPALRKQVTQVALTKTVWYGPLKQTLHLVGINITKSSFAKTVTKVVPVVGGVISGGMTLVSLNDQSHRLKDRLRELPPPGVDSAWYLAVFKAYEEQKPATAAPWDGALNAIGGVASGAAGTVGDVVSGAAEAVGSGATSIADAAAGAAGNAVLGAQQWVQGAFGILGNRRPEPDADPTGAGHEHVDEPQTHD